MHAFSTGPLPICHPVTGGQVKRGKPTTLMPGESVREFLPGPVAKQVEVFDARNPDKALWGGTLGCKGESRTFSVAAGEKTVVREVAPRRK